MDKEKMKWNFKNMEKGRRTNQRENTTPQREGRAGTRVKTKKGLVGVNLIWVLPQLVNNQLRAQRRIIS